MTQLRHWLRIAALIQRREICHGTPYAAISKSSIVVVWRLRGRLCAWAFAVGIDSDEIEIVGPYGSRYAARHVAGGSSNLGGNN
jgi:hypothetical protein